MPIYEYECLCCGVHFELKQGFTESPANACPHCQGKVRRVFQPAPVIFKGSGFYVTDHRPRDIEDSKKSPPVSTEKTPQDKAK
ncbi:MAG: FmdB family zinc ribbon protein [Chloroflexota bacterium]